MIIFTSIILAGLVGYFLYSLIFDRGPKKLDPSDQQPTQSIHG